MPMSWQTVDIPLAAGPDLKADPRALNPPGLGKLENGVFDEVGGIQKRPGFVALSVLTDAGATIAAARMRALGVRGDELVLFASGRAYSWSEKTSRWQDRGRF